MAVIHDRLPNGMWLDNIGGGGGSSPCVLTRPPPLSVRPHISVSVRREKEKKLLTTQDFA